MVITAGATTYSNKRPLPLPSEPIRATKAMPCVAATTSNCSDGALQSLQYFPLRPLSDCASGAAEGLSGGTDAATSVPGLIRHSAHRTGHCCNGRNKKAA